MHGTLGKGGSYCYKDSEETQGLGWLWCFFVVCFQSRLISLCYLNEKASNFEVCEICISVGFHGHLHVEW